MGERMVLAVVEIWEETRLVDWAVRVMMGGRRGLTRDMLHGNRPF